MPLTKVPPTTIDESYHGKVNGFDVSYWPTHGVKVRVSRRMGLPVEANFNVEDAEALIVAIRDAVEEVRNVREVHKLPSR